MRIKILPAAAAAAILAFPAGAKDLPPETPLIVDGPVMVEAADFEAALLRVPPERRVEFRTSYDRVAGMVDNVFIARSFAAKARAAGLDKDPVIQHQLEQAEDAVLADRYMREIEKGAAATDLTVRARELYEADPDRFRTPEEVYVQSILISNRWRTRETALGIANKIIEDARAGKEDFLQLAARYSDDSSKANNGGDLGWSAPTSFVEPVAQWLAKADKKGEVSPPIEWSDGYHVIRFVDRRKPAPVPFEKVRAGIVRAQRELLDKKRREDAVREVRSSKTVTTYADNVAALVVPVEGLLSRESQKVAPK